jgi:putative endonuclease
MTISPNFILTGDYPNFERRKCKDLGDLGENLAARHLTAKGYNLIAKNYFIRGGEIDLILKKDGIIVFVEVKTRRTGKFGTAADALTPNKKRKLLRAIRTYLGTLTGFTNWRADLVAIDFTAYNRANITHYKNIFET